jgi:hypothetical protein
MGKALLFPSPFRGTPLPRRSRTRVTKLPGCLSYRFFPTFSAESTSMSRLFTKTRQWRRPLWRLQLLCFTVLAYSLSVLADTPGLLRTVPAGGCYCRCGESHQRRGCVKLCDSKRYASRRRAVKCVKPHMQTPANNSNAGPRFPHPSRAEHAKLHQ